MMDWTDRHCRAFHRALTSRALLYTEMVTAPAVLHGDRDHLLGLDAVEHPVALQLGGSNPAELAEARNEALDWAHASAAGEEDPGASIVLLDVRLPSTVKGDGVPPR